MLTREYCGTETPCCLNLPFILCVQRAAYYSTVVGGFLCVPYLWLCSGIAVHDGTKAVRAPLQRRPTTPPSTHMLIALVGTLLLD